MSNQKEMEKSLNNNMTVSPGELIDILKITIPAKMPTMIVGPPGCGKSEIVSQVCRQLGYACIIDHPVVSDPTDAKGIPYVHSSDNGPKAEFLPYGFLTKLMEAKTPTVAFLDDLGQAPPSVQAAYMQLILARRINGHKVSDNVVFIAATNRKQDKAGVSGILEPVKSRFSTILHLEPNLDDFCKYLIDNKMPSIILAFTRYKPQFILDFKPTVDMVNSPCPRTIVNAARILQQNPPDHLFLPMISGAAGKGFAVELYAFLSTWRNMPNLDLILMDPESSAHKVPTDPATLWSVAIGLAMRVNEKTTEPIIKYGIRMAEEVKENGGPECSMTMLTSCMYKYPETYNSPSFSEWATKIGSRITS